jgi:peptide-methionine (S)-S-oxide reductase
MATPDTPRWCGTSQSESAQLPRPAGSLLRNPRPTTLNRQATTSVAKNVGDFYHTPAQKAEADKFISELSRGKAFADPIVTEVVPAVEFYLAERYHQEYFQNNPNQPYCHYVVAPKVAKFREKFARRMKK